MCNCKDLESRYLGLSLIEGCVEHLNTGNIIIKVVFSDKTTYQYDWFEFIDICANYFNYDSFGNVLYNLLYRGIYKEYSTTFILKENDQSN